MSLLTARRFRSALFPSALALTVALPSQLALPAPAGAATGGATSVIANTGDTGFGPGAPGLGDPYYPRDGNGG
jgi:hypothetical protein